MKKFVFAILILLLSAGMALGVESKIEVFPASPYSHFIIYQTLAIFWLFILSLIVIIKMKLREIRRAQKLGLDRQEHDVPSLE